MLLIFVGTILSPQATSQLYSARRNIHYLCISRTQTKLWCIELLVSQGYMLGNTISITMKFSFVLFLLTSSVAADDGKKEALQP
jgi:hypothetical protein